MEQRKLSDQANMLVDLSKVCGERQEGILVVGRAPPCCMSKSLGRPRGTFPEGAVLGPENSPLALGREKNSNPPTFAQSSFMESSLGQSLGPPCLPSLTLLNISLGGHF